MSLRWYVKKAARQGVALAAAPSVLAQNAVRATVAPLLGGVGALAPFVGPRVRVLTYHRIGDEEPQDPFCVSREAFDAQIGWLAERNLGVSLDDVIEFVAGKKSLPDGACLVTVDDGCLSTLSEFLPTLRRHGVPGVAFVSSSLVARAYAELPERYLDWDEIRELADDGLVEVGSHAHSHRSLGLMDPAEARDEAKQSKEMIEERLGREVRSFAYPFGTRADFSATTERVLADAGYQIAFNSMHGAIRTGMDPISLPRVKVEGGEGLWMFDLSARGAMDPWRIVDANLWRLQRVRREIV